VRSGLTRRSKTRWTTALVAAATLIVSCATAPPQPPLPPGAGSAGTGQVASDELLANAVYSELNADPTYYFRHVEVRIDKGVAHLSGYVWSTDAIYRARRIAQSVPGVTGVATSQLELERNGRNSGVTR
jgi:BON domain